MTVTVRLFAGAADLVGLREAQVELPDGSSVEQLSASLGNQFPALLPLLSISRWAIDRQFVESKTIISSRQEIALIPPVSGG